MTLSTADLPLDDLAHYHRNARDGDIGAIVESLRILGQYRPIVVNRGTHTGRRFEILAGNHTAKAARALGWETIAAVLVDYDEALAAKVNLADNRTADLGTYDDTLLAELLVDLAQTDDLDGTGYTGDDLDDMLALLREDADEDDPDEPKPTNYRVVIECDTEADRTRTVTRLLGLGYTIQGED